jgi:hypothetical protein|tara:strand:+ start:105 stop:344 length:240 start_codon:yes stop_codon:yes gene_type:complete
MSHGNNRQDDRAKAKLESTYANEIEQGYRAAKVVPVGDAEKAKAKYEGRGLDVFIGKHFKSSGDEDKSNRTMLTRRRSL